jgi:hypothetical protein
MKRQVLAFLGMLALAGCTAPQVTVLGNCPIPEALDYVAKGPDPLVVQDTPRQAIVEDDAKQRAARGTLAKDFNDLHDYVRDKCAK